MGKNKTNKNRTNKKRFIPNECTNKMSFDECELAILRQAVDTNEKIAGQKLLLVMKLKI